MLTGHGFRNFSKAEIERNPQRILNILYLTKYNHIKIILAYSGLNFQANIASLDKKQIELSVFEFQIMPERMGAIYFETQNRYYFAKVYILDFEGEVKVDFPQELRYFQDRKYPRVRFDDLFMRFTLEHSSIFKMKGEEIEILNRFPFLFTEVTRTKPSLKLMYKILISRIQKISSNFSINMLNKKGRDKLDLFETILAESKSSLLIEDTSKMSSYIDKLNAPNLTNLHKYYQTKMEEVGEYEALLEIEKLKQEDSRNFLVSYLMAPLSMYDKVIGYVRIQTDQFHSSWIHPLVAEEFHMVCKLFSYGLTSIQVQNTYFDANSINTRILNISTSGLLMEIFDKVLFEYLHNFKRLKMRIPIAGEEIELYGEIVRFQPRGGAYYIGVYFFKSAPNDYKKLAQYINDSLVYHFF